MRRPSRRLAVLCGLLIVLSVAAFPGFAEEPPVRLVTGDWPPYVSQSLPGRGPVTEIVVAAFAAAGRGTEIEFLPWKRCELNLAEGEAFGAFPYVRSPAREQAFDFSDSFMLFEDRFFYLKTRLPGFTYRSIEDLRPLLIGGAIGYHYEDSLRGLGLRLDMASDPEASFKKLLAGRVDVVLEERRVGLAILAELLDGRTEAVGMTQGHFSRSENCLMVSRAYPGAADLLRRFNQGLARIRADGTYAGILRRHGLAP